jgi:hypothetical protein
MSEFFLDRLQEMIINSQDLSAIISETNPSEIPCEFKKQPDVLKARIVAFIRLERYEEALSLIRSLGLGLETQFEEAYCLYRLNDLVAAKNCVGAALTQIPSNCPLHHHLLQLKGQVVISNPIFDIRRIA